MRKVQPFPLLGDSTGPVLFVHSRDSGSQLMRGSHKQLLPHSVLNSILKAWRAQACPEPCFTSPWGCAKVGVWAPWLLVASGLSLGHAWPSARGAVWGSPASPSGGLSASLALQANCHYCHTTPGPSVWGMVHFSDFRAKFSAFMNWKLRETDAKSELNCVFMKNLSDLWSQVYWPQGRRSSWCLVIHLGCSYTIFVVWSTVKRKTDFFFCFCMYSLLDRFYLIEMSPGELL